MINNIDQEMLEKFSQHELFKGFQKVQIQQVLDYFTTVNIQGGEVLIKAGQSNTPFYFVEDGNLRVHLLSDQTNPVIVLTPGQSIGEMAMIDHQPASANVIADTDCQLLSINKTEFWELFSIYHLLSINMLNLVSNRLKNSRSMFEKIKGLVHDVEQNALIDPLTNLYNRRWLDDTLPRIIQRTLADDVPLTVMMLDIDYFKQYNDHHGHLAGDRVLQCLASEITKNIRPEDFVTRYGGEEFFIILPGLNLKSSHQIAERLRNQTEKLQVTHHNGNALPNITISLGLAESRQQQDIASLIQHADDALYQAKNNGRNSVYYDAS